MTAKMIYLHALTPVHSGTGQTAAIIDLPIAREKATGWPIIPASSLKGVLRDALTSRDAAGKPSNQIQLDELFGKQEESGALCIGDQRLLCLPVRSYHGTFAYLTCPLVLRRLARDAKAFGIGLNLPDPVPAVTDTSDVLNVLTTGTSVLVQGQKVYLEDLDLAAVPNAIVTEIAGILATILFPAPEETAGFLARFALVSDAVFDFLCETATEVSARVRLNDDAKTVVAGGLWYEEAVPAEAIFCGPVLVEARFQSRAVALLAQLTPTLVQIGGKSTVGRGQCRVVVA